MKRREFNRLLAAASTIGLGHRGFAQASDLQQRISNIIRKYSEQGIHRTATDADNHSAQWLLDHAARLGVGASLESFSFDQVNIVSAQLH